MLRGFGMQHDPGLHEAAATVGGAQPHVTFLPRRTSITSSVGTSTSSIWSSSSCSATVVRICSAIFFSKFDKTLTEYHLFAI